MRDKHISIAEDSQLLKEIHSALKVGIPDNKAEIIRLMTVKFLCYFSLLVLAYLGILIAGNAAILILSYTGYGLLAVLLGFNFAHDFSHNTIFRNKAANHWCFILLYTLVGAHAEAWKYRHIHSHHYAPNVKDYDTDLEITSLIRVEPESRIRWFHRYQHIYAALAYTSYSLYWVFIKDFVIYLKGGQSYYTKPVILHLSFWLQKISYFSYLLVIPMIYGRQSWSVTLCGFIIMHLVQSLFLLFTFFMTHHVESSAYFKTNDEGYIPTSWLRNQIESSNDFYPFSRTANFIFGGFNNHIAHHLFPHIHHVHYPSLNKILYPILQAHHIQPNVTSYPGGVISHLKHLKRMGCGK